jgi:hypothetical protein
MTIISKWVYLKVKESYENGERWIPICKHYSTKTLFNNQDRYYMSISKINEMNEDFEYLTFEDINNLLTEEDFLKKIQT